MPEKKRYSEKDKHVPRREKSNRQEGDRPQKYPKRDDATRSYGKESDSYRGGGKRTGASDSKGYRKRDENEGNADRPFKKNNDRFDDKPGNSRPSRAFERRENSKDFSDRKTGSRSFKSDNDFRADSGKAGRGAYESGKRSDDSRNERPSRASGKRDNDRSDFSDRKRDSRSAKPFRDFGGEADRPYRKGSDASYKSKSSRFERRDESNEASRFDRKRKSDDFKPGRGFKDESKGKRSYGSHRDSGNYESGRPSRSFNRRDDDRAYGADRNDDYKPYKEQGERKGRKGKETEVEEEMPLNKYIAHSGECSRRDAAELVKQGKVKVNDELILDPGHKVTRGDKVTLSGKKLTPQKGLVYILLNKPKGYITTTEDEKGRRTVIDIVQDAAEGSRLFPVGRLDRNTTGLLLITNDGALAQKLSHPSYNAKKIYHVTLDKQLTKADFEKVLSGVELEDGIAHADALAYLEAKNELGIEIHSGKNRIVRRIFESMGYVVEKLDRMMYAGLTKKNLPRGKWRYLNEREIVLLKHFKTSH